MYTALKYTFITGSVIGLLSVITKGNTGSNGFLPKPRERGINGLAVALNDTPPPPVTASDLHYSFPDNGYDEPVYNQQHPLILNNPANIKTETEYDPATKEYNFTQKMGTLEYRPTTYMTDEEYRDYMFKKQVKSYWKSRIKADDINSPKSSLIPKLTVGGEMFDRIFGGNTVDIRPQGSAELIFGLVINKNENPAIPVKQRRISNFDFNMKVQLNLVGKIGEKLKLTTNYNTEASFDFENQMKLEYNGLEDEILKKIEAGNVSLPLNSSLITGSQSLFGIKTQMQFGRLSATTVLSQQRGKKTEVTVQGGSQTTPFTLGADNYEANRHYFLAQYFRDNYNNWMATVPVINTPIVVSKIEVWVTNRTAQYSQARNLVAFADLGEDGTKIIQNLSSAACQAVQAYVIADSLGTFPKNGANSLYNMITNAGNGLLADRDYTAASQRLSDAGSYKNTCNSGEKFMESGRDYELVSRARKLEPTEYTLNRRLGFISLNQALNFDEVLSVSFQYTINGETYQVGEFSDQFPTGDKALVLKLLKSTQVNTKVAMWDLMMKNVYSIGAYQINAQDFKFDVYRNTKGVDMPYIALPPNDGKLLIQVMDIDRINVNGDKMPDGYFDFIQDVTINPSSGRIYLPSIEPFGNDLRSKFTSADPAINDYIFQELYDSTRIAAQQLTKKNVYKFKGSYKSSSSSEISLNAMNVPQGSVTVTAGGVPLKENVDYTVDYTLGRVKIINESILNSGQPIKISSENNSLFNIQQKSLVGTRLDFKVNKDFSVGGTLLHLNERPLTQKVNAGDEPVSNTIWGTDFNYRADAPWLTRLVDKIPLINTKESSSIQTAGEFAQLIPGHSKAIGKTGNSYLDDFEGSISLIDLRSQGSWFLASVPQGQTDIFPEALKDSVQSGFNRAKIAWYTVDQSVFYQQTSGLTPGNITKSLQSNHFMRQVVETEIFPNKQPPNGQPIILPVLDLAYYPEERGPYNYDVNGTSFSKGIDISKSLQKGDIRLNDPASRWAGIMRRMETNDFQTANIEFIQFWMMDPFNDDYNSTFPGYTKPTNGEMYVNLGNISEDVLRDGRMSFENGLPTQQQQSLAIDSTSWGIVPAISPINNAFNLQESERPDQDVGYDGLKDENERTYYNAAYMNLISDPTVRGYANLDPSGDNYHFYRGDDYDGNGGANTLFRYKKYNGVDGNSPTESQYTNLNSSHYPTTATTMPNSEDINRDNTLNETEAYYQYKIKITPQDINPQNVGNNYITNAYETTVNTPDGQSYPITWYQFKIPITSFENKIGSIEGFNSIRFMRMFMKNFSAPVVCRMARMELVRSDWRSYQYDLSQAGDYIAVDNNQTTFDIAAVNIQENGTKSPVNYVIPPGINQQQNVQTTNLVLLNEQALVLRTCGLKDGHSRAAYKNLDNDVRSFKKLKMFVHAEKYGNNPINDGDVTLFMRIGTDFTSNYYEYEVPLKITAPGHYDQNNDGDRERVWPGENEVDIDFAELTALKFKRQPGSIDMVQSTTADGRTIRVFGNPSISSLKSVMVGIRNPKDLGGESKCIEVWINELRLTDFDQKGGWAANARVTAKLADVGQVALSGAYMTPFFGSIEKKVSERSRETTKQYDASSTLQLNKFLPADWKINLPMYIGQSETYITPQYDPSNPDVLMSAVNADNGFSREDISAIKERAQDYTRRRGLNFTNISKGKGKNASTKSHVWDVENFSVTYAYTEQFKRSITVDHNLQKTYRGALAYNFQTTPKNIKPFGKSKAVWLNNKWFALVKDINFTPLPSRLGFNTDVNRTYNEVLTRDITSIVVMDSKTLTQYNKTFNMTRTYDMKWDLTKNLKVDFTANNIGRILEPYGKIDTKEEKDTIKNNIIKLGTNTAYTHTANLNYSVPINKIPLFDFVTATYSYKANYSWTRRPFAADTIGNTIQNGNTQSWNGQFNMVNLYNKIPYFKKVNNKNGKAPISSKDGKDIKDPKSLKDPNDTTKKERDYPVLEHIARLIMTLKQAQLTYSINSGTTLPGFDNTPQMMGIDMADKNYAPGLGFVFGSQENIIDRAEQNHWIVKRHNLATPYAHMVTKTLNASAKLEPFRDLKIDLTGTRTYGENNGLYLSYDPVTDIYKHNTATKTGTFSISTITIGSAFKNDNKSTHTNAVFEKFRDLRSTYQQLLWEKNPYADHSKVNDGYDANQQDVIMYSFMAAYTNKGVGKTKMELFSKIPMPNWSVTYDGLGKLKPIKKYFKTFVLRHTYRSTYNMGAFSNNILYKDTLSTDMYSYTRVDPTTPGSNFISQYQIGTVTISESFAPLIKVDMTFNDKGFIKGLLANVEIKRDRNISLISTGPQVNETKGNEIVIGAGYRYPNLEIKRFKVKGKPIKSDLNFKVDLSIRKNTTVLRRVIDDVNQVTQGQNVITIKTAVDYVVSSNVNIRFFFDRVINKPVVSTSYPTATTNTGISLRFNLGQ